VEDVKAECFEDLNAWKSSRELVRKIYSLTKKRSFARDFGLVDQIRRAAVSVMSNIAEGFERGSNREFIQYLYMAKDSCGELRSQLVIAFDQNYIDQNEFREINHLAMRVGGMLGALINYLKSTKVKGSKFKLQKAINTQTG
jgi:four helix bundle protein